MTVFLIAACLIAAKPPDSPSHVDARRQSPALQRFAYAQVHMGVRFDVVFYATDQKTANDAADAAFSRIEQLNGSMSDYDPHSELSRLGAASPSREPVRVSADLWEVLSRAQKLSVRSGGAFDVTVGPLTALWRRSRRGGRLPAPDQLASALRSVGYQFLELDSAHRTARLLRGGMRLDLGAIAKGYAADQAIRTLAAHGVTRALVNGSGDIAIADPPPDRPGWRIAVARLKLPNGRESEPVGPLILSRVGISTSGDAEQHLTVDGIRYSHVINPRTGMALTTQCGVTVVAPDCTTSDSMGTAVSVLGPRAGIALVEATRGVEALMVIAKGNATQSFRSRGFAALPTEKR